MKKENRPFKRVPLTIQEMIDEANHHLKTNEWDGKRFKGPLMNHPLVTKELTSSPNYFKFVTPQKPKSSINTLQVEVREKLYHQLQGGEVTIIYKVVDEKSMPTYVDVRESKEGLILNNPNLLPEDEIRLDAYAHGIFGFVPRYYDQIEITCSKANQSLTSPILGVCFLPEAYYKGGDFRCNYSEPIPELAWEKAKEKGKQAIQDLLYDPNGPDTKWYIAIQLGEIKEEQ
ncbi:MAG: hypothetical protein PUJ69_06640 [Porphyromonas somerae]|uniref:hypothetical protein n=1 Tax=Porphyromonas somerae TaxID=322095 RepID=UPI0026F1D8BA|nr:hypothetical protein [Porphyromonas somerae]MDD7558331.1 hypothetical protein [Porphyromonas somerae]MDY5815429.1 hypothetical protein [Porphyromonas somerae]